ncbi:hypothetical protein [Nocardia pseudovaccinii]|uniref:hypothetical protein n=1 Tax=Nocardia pseudovaccinii TaxID=189540 RepID=UPI0007A4D8D8|nr:hypothetical protein [Nocardia pseudovaccinii]
MHTLDHPAVTVAIDALTGADRDLVPVSAIVRDDIAAVVIDGEQGRWIVFAHPGGGQWATSGITYGAPRPTGPRADSTAPHQPLQRLSTRFRAGADGEPGWFAVIGQAANDAVSVSVVSTVEERTEPLDANGLAFVIVRCGAEERPPVTVNTRDGRQVVASPLVA